MAGLAEKDYGVKNDMGPMDTTVSPAVNAGEAGGFERSSSPPAYSLKAKAAGTADTESLNSDITLAAQEEGIDPAFYAKVQVLNRALSEIGMGRYQWELFFSGGFGWFADNICEYEYGYECGCFGAGWPGGCAPLRVVFVTSSCARFADCHWPLATWILASRGARRGACGVCGVLQ